MDPTAPNGPRPEGDDRRPQPEAPPRDPAAETPDATAPADPEGREAVEETEAAKTMPSPDVTRPSAARVPVAGTLAVLALGLLVIAYLWRDRPVTTSHYLLLSLLMFSTGALGVLLRRNALVLFMCIELMLNAANVAFVAFARMHGDMSGHAVVLFVIIVAAAEVTVGLAIIVSIFRRRMSVNVDDLSAMRW